MSPSPIEAVAFDCYGTLIDFGDVSFARAYGRICEEQGIPIDGQTFYDKWMEIWRRLARDGRASDTASVGVKVAVEDRPGPLSEAEAIPPHPAHHTPSAGRNRSLDGPLPPFRPYREEWPEHFALCFEELGVKGDPHAAHERLVELLATAPAFPESRRVIETVGRRLPVAVMSNADDAFLQPVLARNGIVAPLTVSSETARAYKPHVAIFRMLSEYMGVPLESIMYVGDSRLADIAGAKNAGLWAAWVNRRTAENRSIEGSRNGGTSDPSPAFEPDYEIDSLDLLLDILQLR